MQTQRYRHRVEVQELVTVKDSHGNKDEQWQTKIVDGVLMDSVPAEVLTGPGRLRWEAMIADKIQADVGARITMRWFPGLTAADRILWDGNVFGIMSDPIEDKTGRRWIQCDCSNVGAADGES